MLLASTELCTCTGSAETNRLQPACLAVGEEFMIDIARCMNPDEYFSMMGI